MAAIARLLWDELASLVYDDLRRLAASYLRVERSNHTLSPTDLVHEAYIRLVDQTRVDWRGRTHFFAVAAQRCGAFSLTTLADT